MKAMILAAGFGTRLKPYTDLKPKALIEINGTPILELLIKRLIKVGITDIIINVHYLAQMIIDFLKRKNNFGINIQLSVEQKILGTGGGIKKAAYFFKDGNPFVVHNVDIITDIDLIELYRYHINKQNIATLAVMKRTTDRYFIVDQDNLICGHGDRRKDRERIVRKPNGTTQILAFSGIHVISPQIFSHIIENSQFSIIDLYLRLIAAGHLIGVYRMDRFYWKDLGKRENIKEIDLPSYLL